MIYFFMIISAVLPVALKIFLGGFSWWLVPIIAVGIFAILFILSLAVLLISFALIDTKSPPERGSRYFRFMINSLLPTVLFLARVKVNAEGVEKVPENARLFFICNHQHDLDPVIFFYLFPTNKLSFIGKKEIYTEMPYIGKIMHKLNCLPIDRENNREAVKTIISAVKILKEEKASVALFPEGYTSRTSELLPFRNGAFKIAYKANVPIAVCVLNNTRSIPKNIFRRKTVVDFKVLDLLTPEQFSSMSTVELGDKLHTQMKQTIDEMRKKS